MSEKAVIALLKYLNDSLIDTLGTMLVIIVNYSQNKNKYSVGTVLKSNSKVVGRG